MKENKFKRILSIVLAVAMLIGTVAFTPLGNFNVQVNAEENGNNTVADLVLKRKGEVLKDGEALHIDEIITISTVTTGTSIRYTLDGSDPTESSEKYPDEGIKIDEELVKKNLTIKAFATKSGYNPSKILEQTHPVKYVNTVAAPTFTPVGGTYTTDQTVELSTDTVGADIYYTLDGSEPTENSIKYDEENPIIVKGVSAKKTTIKAIAIKAGMNDSEVATATYVIDYGQNVAAPIFSESGGTYKNTIEVKLTSPTPGSNIFYTLDGSDPKTNWSRNTYNSPIKITGKFQKTVTIRAYAVAIIGGVYTESDVVEATYTIDYGTGNTVADPTFSKNNNVPLADGTTLAKTDVIKLTTTTPDAEIYYTIDGTDPTENSVKYEDGLSVDGFYGGSLTIKAIAVKEGMNCSEIVKKSFTIKLEGKVDAPKITLKSGTYTTGQTVELSTVTEGADIYYTLDGSEPTEKSNQYYDGITVNGMYTKTTTIKAIAIKAGMYNSEVVTATYVIDYGQNGATPVFSKNGGTYKKAIDVTLTSPTPWATIYYTLDGSDPITSQSKKKYDSNSPIKITGKFEKTVTIRAYAVAIIGGEDTESDVVEATYTIDYDTGITVVNPTFTKSNNEDLANGTTLAKDDIIKLSTTTEGATIYYTTDGSNPTESSKPYPKDGLNVSDFYGGKLTIKAIAVKEGMNCSEIVERNFTVEFKDTVSKPTFNIQSGTYTTDQVIKLTTNTADATIYYTTDGSEPTMYNETNHTGNIIIDGKNTKTTTIKAIAVKKGMNSSEVVSATYTIDYGTIAKPEFNPTTGTYNTPITVTASSSTPGSTIYYTLDGSNPKTSNNRLYSNNLALYLTGKFQKTVTIMAYAKATIGGVDTESDVVKAIYTIDCGKDKTVAKPTFTKNNNEPLANSATLTKTDVIKLSTKTAGAEIYYTIDGSDPTESSAKYKDGLSVDGFYGGSLTIRAIAVKDGMNCSEIIEGYFTVNFENTVTKPTFNIASGSYRTDQTVTLSTDTVGATIYYTIDGTEPTEKSSKYEYNPIIVNGARAKKTTIKAIAIKRGMNSSEVALAAYTIDYGTIAKPEFNHTTGIYNKPITVTASSSTPGSTIYYTLDGSNPKTSNNRLSINKLTLNLTGKFQKTVTIRAYAGAYIGGIYTESDVVEVTFTIDYGKDKTVADPTFTNNDNKPLADGAILNKNDVIKLSTTPDDAEIYYTLDGSDPTENNRTKLKGNEIHITEGSFYGGPLTIKAIAVKDGMNCSEIVKKSFTIKFEGKVDAPKITPKSGTYTTGQTVELSTVTEGADIYYTLDGSEPTENSSKYDKNNHIKVNGMYTKTTTIKAIAVKKGRNNSEVVTAEYTIDYGQTVDIPVYGFNYKDGVVTSFAFFTNTEDVTFVYTDDGTDPATSTTKNSVQSRPNEFEKYKLKGNSYAFIPINTKDKEAEDITIRIIAVREGWNPSPEAELTFTVKPVDIDKNAPTTDVKIDLTKYRSFELENMKVSDLLMKMVSSTNGEPIYTTTPSGITTLWSIPLNKISSSTLDRYTYKEYTLDDEISSDYLSFISGSFGYYVFTDESTETQYSYYGNVFKIDDTINNYESAYKLYVGNGKQYNSKKYNLYISVNEKDYDFTVNEGPHTIVTCYNEKLDNGQISRLHVIPVSYDKFKNTDKFTVGFKLRDTNGNYTCTYYKGIYSGGSSPVEKGPQITTNTIDVKINEPNYIVAEYRNYDTGDDITEILNLKVQYNYLFLDVGFENIFAGEENIFYDIKKYLNHETKDVVFKCYNKSLVYSSDTYKIYFKLQNDLLLGITEQKDAVIKACVGRKTLEEMKALVSTENIKDKILDSTIGYEADFSSGVDFTFLLSNDTVQHVKVIIENDNSIILADKIMVLDKILHKGQEVNCYGDNITSSWHKKYAFIKEDNVGLDKLSIVFSTLYDITVYDENNNKVTLTEMPSAMIGHKTYALPEADYRQQVTYYVQLNGSTKRVPISYNIIDETFISKSPKLFIGYKNEISPFFIDKHMGAFNIYNLGKQDLTGVRVKLSAIGVKIPEYCTITGDGITIPPLDYDYYTKYGTTPDPSMNAQIVLLRDGSGNKVSGTLTISADGQEDIVLTLTEDLYLDTTPSHNSNRNEYKLEVKTDGNGNKITTETRRDSVIVETTEDKNGNVEAVVTIPSYKPIVTVEIPADLGQTAGIVFVEITNEAGTTKKVIATYTGGKITVKLEESVTVKVIDKVIPYVFQEYKDIANHWAYGSIVRASRLGLFVGTSATTFSPNSPMTREQMWMVLSRLQGEGQDNMENAMKWAMEKGITDGSNPKNDVTREQFATLLWRAMGEPKSAYDLSNYSDHANISPWAKEAFAWAVEIGLVNGTSSGILSPQGKATRAQIATIFDRLIY